MTRAWHDRSARSSIRLLLAFLLGVGIVSSALQGQTVVPDPTTLPSTLITAANTSAYNALNVPNMVPGETYTDPVTGATIVKLTSRTAPIPGTSVWMAGTDYGAGGNRIGRPTNGVYPIVIARWVGSSMSAHLIKFNLATRAVTYHSAAPGGQRELQRAFSYVTPNIFYAVDHDGGTIRKWNVTGTTPTEVTGNNFPKTGLPMHGASRMEWFQISADDRWFVMKPGNTDWCVAWDSQTNTTYDMQFTGGGFDQPVIDKEGGYVSIMMSSTLRRWAIVSGAVSNITGSPVPYSGHSDAVRRYAFGADGDNGAGLWRVDLHAASPSYQYPATVRNTFSLYTSGNWVDQPATLQQWTLIANQPYPGNNISGESFRRGALVLHRLDGSDARLLAHSYGVGDVNGEVGYYTDSIWPNVSPDGRFVLFKSNMGTAGGFSSQFAAMLPTSGASVVAPTPPSNLRIVP